MKNGPFLPLLCVTSFLNFRILRTRSVESDARLNGINTHFMYSYTCTRSVRYGDHHVPAPGINAAAVLIVCTSAAVVYSRYPDRTVQRKR